MHCLLRLGLQLFEIPEDTLELRDVADVQRPLPREAVNCLVEEEDFVPNTVVASPMHHERESAAARQLLLGAVRAEEERLSPSWASVPYASLSLFVRIIS